MARERRRCTWCDKELPVNQDGQLQRHPGATPHPLGHKMLSCPGGRQWDGVPHPKLQSISLYECERCGEPSYIVNDMGQCPDCVASLHDEKGTQR